MTLDGIRDELQAIACELANGGDAESSQQRADFLITEAVRLLGREDIAEAFEDASKHVLPDDGDPSDGFDWEGRYEE